jgi:hypothetical protein
MCPGFSAVNADRLGPADCMRGSTSSGRRVVDHAKTASPAGHRHSTSPRRAVRHRHCRCGSTSPSYPMRMAREVGLADLPGGGRLTAISINRQNNVGQLKRTTISPRDKYNHKVLLTQRLSDRFPHLSFSRTFDIMRLLAWCGHRTASAVKNASSPGARRQTARKPELPSTAPGLLPHDENAVVTTGDRAGAAEQ